MAEAPHEGSPFQLLFTVLGFMAVLIALWFLSGGYKKADLNGIFLYPPAPFGSGTGYGPQVGEPNQNYTNTNSQ